MTERLYFVECTATYTGSAAERNVKDYARQFNGVVCDHSGWGDIYAALVNCNNEFMETHPRCTPTKVQWREMNGNIFLEDKNGIGNCSLLSVKRVGQFYLGKKVKLQPGAEYAEWEG